MRSNTNKVDATARNIEERFPGLISKVVEILNSDTSTKDNWLKSGKAACTDKGPIWTNDVVFGSVSTQREVADTFCRGCPVQAECLASQLRWEWSERLYRGADRQGVFGGILGAARRRLWSYIKPELIGKFQGQAPETFTDRAIKSSRALGAERDDKRHEPSDVNIWFSPYNRSFNSVSKQVIGPHSTV